MLSRKVSTLVVNCFTFIGVVGCSAPNSISRRSLGKGTQRRLSRAGRHEGSLRTTEWPLPQTLGRGVSAACHLRRERRARIPAGSHWPCFPDPNTRTRTNATTMGESIDRRCRSTVAARRLVRGATASLMVTLEWSVDPPAFGRTGFANFFHRAVRRTE